MSDVAIRVEGMGKRYRIGSGPTEPYGSLRDSLVRSVKAPLRRLRGAGDGSAQRDVWALKDVSFEVKHGEAVGIIGRNGAGKSTLLKLLSRITEPTVGKAEVYGRVGSLLEVGTGFHAELTGRENIYLNGAVMGMSRADIRRRFDEIVDFSGVETYLDTPVKRYSSGMYMRLAFAVAAHLEPEVLIVDEVLAVGDAEFQKKCLGKMSEVAKQGRAVLFVSHSMPAVTRLCGRAILLNTGCVAYDGMPHHIVAKYLQSDKGTTAVREWADQDTVQGNDVVRLRSVRVLNQTGHISDTIDIRKPVEIEVTYHNESNDIFPYAVLHLYDDNDVCAFISGDFSNFNWRHYPRKFNGTVTTTCTIPGNFLSEGVKRVLVALVTHNPTEVLATERDAVSFLVVDHSEGDGARGEYVGEFQGVVRPLLNWTVRHSQHSESENNWLYELRNGLESFHKKVGR